MSTIYFATNRQPDRDVNPTDFGEGFARSNLGDLRFGRAEVADGKFKPGSIEVLPDNPKQGSRALFTELRGSMKADERDTLLFIHGFNVSFTAALETAGRISTRYAAVSKGAYTPNVFVFSWPSDGKVHHYFNDRHDAEASGYGFARGMLKLSEFLRGTSPKAACRQRIHLVCHSMGNYVLRHAVQQARKIEDGQSLARVFDNIILAAADEDSDALELDHKLGRLPEMAQRITVYFNSGDLALRVSDSTKGNPDRLGHDGPIRPHNVPAKVVLVDASSVVHGVTEHSYFEQDDTVAADIVAVLQGQGSESIANRTYVPHANKFRLGS